MNQASIAARFGDSGLSSGQAFATGAPACVSAAEGYDRWAPTYDQVPNPLLNLEERHLMSRLPNLSGKRVLDLACGTGRWLQRMSAQGAGAAVGVDLSAAMLRVAGQKAAITGCLAQADCLTLPFPSIIFDLIICSFAVGHIRDLEAMVCEVARVTKVGGEVFVSDLHAEAYARGWRTGFRDRHSVVQIEMIPRTAEVIIRAFYSRGFECLTHVPLCLGEPERPMFAQAGKHHVFAAACQIPAVLFCRFKLTRPSQTRDEECIR